MKHYILNSYNFCVYQALSFFLPTYLPIYTVMEVQGTLKHEKVRREISEGHKVQLDIQIPLKVTRILVQSSHVCICKSPPDRICSWRIYILIRKLIVKGWEWASNWCQLSKSYCVWNKQKAPGNAEEHTFKKSLWHPLITYSVHSLRCWLLLAARCRS